MISAGPLSKQPPSKLFRVVKCENGKECPPQMTKQLKQVYEFRLKLRDLKLKEDKEMVKYEGL